jgi:hypothetical protein
MLNGYVNTPLFRHLGSSSWHGRDARLISFFKNLDQRILFVGLVFIFASMGVVLLLGVRRFRPSRLHDEERQSLSFALKSLWKKA